ncbi:hypothetical protein BH09PSE4_BH09PSE4_20440 [soil metagenome]
MSRNPYLRSLSLASGVVAASLLSGCVVAALPVLAGGAIATKAAKGKQHKGERSTPTAQAKQVVTPEGTWTIVNAKEMPPPNGAVRGAPAPVAPAGPISAAVPLEMQYLYGSGEASAISLQAYRALWNYLHVEIRYLRDKTQAKSVILTRDSTLDAPKFDTCGDRKLAVVLDVDETSLLNLGFASDAARRGPGYDAGRWTRWEATGANKVVAVPGAAETLAAVRGDGITVIFNSNRSASSAVTTAAALEGAGLGPVVYGDTLWLRDDGTSSGKDERRWKIAERYCVVAMVGDQLGDFSDLFNDPGLSVPARRAAAAGAALSPLWGAGWFVLPNPVYGTALKGRMDDVFPPDRQWADPAEEKK